MSGVTLPEPLNPLIQRDPMNFKSVLQRYPLLSYFALTYGITWCSLLLFLASRQFQLATLQTQDGFIMFLLMLAGPSVSGLTLSMVLDKRPGWTEVWAGLTRWRVGWRWYGVALLTVPVLTLAILWGLSSSVSPTYAPNFQWIGVVAGLLAGGFEELGWTGFATPRLLRKHNALIAGFSLGLIWAVWHLLADFSSHISTMSWGEWAGWFAVFWILPLTAYRILTTWVYTKTRSLLVAQLMHASYTGWLVTLSPETSGQLVWQTIFAVALWILVAIVMLRQRHTLRILAPQIGQS